MGRLGAALTCARARRATVAGPNPYLSLLSAFACMPFVVTIDGPAGAGKSTVARQLSRRLGFRYLDTGAMYRALTLAAVRAGCPASDGTALGRLAREVVITFDPEGRTFLDGEDVSDGIRDGEVTALVSEVSAHPEVRAAMVGLQREVARGAIVRAPRREAVVCEGRDMGTAVFPAAPVKVYLDADPATRALRRVKDLAARGEEAPFKRVLSDVETRDQKDAGRAASPLRRADDQVYVDTSGLSAREVEDHLEALVLERLRNRGGASA